MTLLRFLAYWLASASLFTFLWATLGYLSTKRREREDLVRLAQEEERAARPVFTTEDHGYRGANVIPLRRGARA
jgi:hypothetical protein